MSALASDNAWMAPRNLPHSLTAVLHAGFVLTGVVTTLLGPILPVLSAKWSLSDTQGGYLFVAQFFGSTAGVILSSYLISRLGHFRSLVAGYALMAIRMAALAIVSWPLCIIAVAVHGAAWVLQFPPPTCSFLKSIRAAPLPRSAS